TVANRMLVTHGAAQSPTPGTLNGVVPRPVQCVPSLLYARAVQVPLPARQFAVPSAQPSFSPTKVRSRTRRLVSPNLRAVPVGGLALGVPLTALAVDGGRDVTVAGCELVWCAGGA